MKSYSQHIKETFKLAFPISLGQLGHIMMGVVDSLMVGKVGSAQLAAASLVNGLFFLILVLGFGMTFALSPLIAISKGEKNNKQCGVILNHGVFVNSIFAVILMILVFLTSYLIPLLNQPADVTKLATSYMQILSTSIIPFVLFACYRQFLEGLSFPNPPMVIAIAANLLNAFLNWIFIYGNLGFTAMGLDGAGYATTVTRLVMMIALVYYVLKSNLLKIYNPALNFKELDYKLINKIVSIGLPSGLQYFLEVAAFSFATIMVGWLGKIPLAANQIALNLASISYMIILGISFAGAVRVGEEFGAKNIQGIRRAGFSAIGLAVIIMFTSGVIFILFRSYIPFLYINEIEVVQTAAKLLVVAAMFQIFDGLQATGIGVLRGLTDVKVPLYVSFGSYWLLGIPTGYLLGIKFGFGAVGVWIGSLVGLAGLGLFLLFRFNNKTKNQNSFSN
ncbi:MAG: MATE family efflux transporter [Ignavibacteria bacterium]|nr:MATE family efflux transporter [Ignavibacteria bacterium]